MTGKGTPVAGIRLRLIVVRHGNTFESGQTPTRVGARTDFPLTAAGREQARRLGLVWRERGWSLSEMWCGPLRRTRETASLMVEAMGCALEPRVDERFREIDYWVDENRTEAEVRLRLGRVRLGLEASEADCDRAGAEALRAWDERAEVPAGWLVDPAALASRWRGFGGECRRRVADGDEKTERVVAVATSNGVARFAGALLEGAAAAAFQQANPKGLKLATGAYGVMALDADGRWRGMEWNVRP